MNKRLLAKASAFAIAAGLCLPQAASAQGAVEALRDEILVTGTKKPDAENVQEVPLAVTAFGDAQIDALKVRNLESLTTSVPNVSLDDIGTVGGYANFSIRGLGINSSIPSVDPAVGVFVDGVYLGVNAGVITDIFDLESIEVLRGPQGILFGRNVTGGAVLINTKDPNTQEFEASFKTAIESGFRGTGNNYYAMGSVTGPIVEDFLGAKLAVYYNNNNGWHENIHPVDGRVDFGEAETIVLRPSFLWTPTDSFDLIARFEHGESDGQGPAAQNHVDGLGRTNPFFTASRDSFTFSIDEPGFNSQDWDQVTAEANLDVPIGDGTITNVFGWRQYDADSLSDIDATPAFLFHANATIDTEQISNEIRYSGRFFNAIDFTTGFYYFQQDTAYNERRFIAGGAAFFNGGGVQDQETWGVFGQFDIDFSDRFTINLGGRYTHEEKDVVISNLLLNTTVCDVRISGQCSEDFVSSDSWNNFNPKVGFQWAATDWMNVYGHWTQGVRSGGYNFRNTAANSIPFVPNPAPPPALVANPGFDPQLLPGPFDEETVNAFELGMKAQPADGRAQINAAIFVNDINDMQREINLADPALGVVQIIQNTADARIFGFEIETQYSLTDNLLLMGSLGHNNGDYNSVLFDIGAPSVSPGVVDQADLLLEIPRLAPWTWALGFVHSLPLGDTSSIDTRFNYSHRDASFYTDNNLGVLNELEIIDASVSLNLNQRAAFSLYGKNLLNEVNFGGDTQLPLSLGAGTFSPLTEGRVIGLEFQLDL